MPIRTDKLIFYHIPKTGGLWVRKSMRRGRMNFEFYREEKDTDHTRLGLKKDHITPRDTPKWFKENRFSFCFVRNPITWYQSFWCHRIKGMLDTKGTKPPHTEFILDGGDIWNNDFEKFMDNVLDKYPNGFVSHLYQCYIQGTDIDFIGRQENLTEDAIKAYRLAGQIFNEKRIRNAGRANVAFYHKYLKEMCICPKSLENKILSIEKWVTENFYNI